MLKQICELLAKLNPDDSTTPQVIDLITTECILWLDRGMRAEWVYSYVFTPLFNHAITARGSADSALVRVMYFVDFGAYKGCVQQGLLAEKHLHPKCIADELQNDRSKTAENGGYITVQLTQNMTIEELIKQFSGYKKSVRLRFITTEIEFFADRTRLNPKPVSDKPTSYRGLSEVHRPIAEALAKDFDPHHG
jgi:hypothetical protein